VTDTATQERTEEPQPMHRPQAEAQQSAVEEREPRGAEVAEQQPPAEPAVEPEVGAPAAEPALEPQMDEPAAVPEAERASRAGEAAEAETTSVRDGPTEFEPRSIELLGNIEVEASAELGHAQLSIREVLELRPGSVVQLNKMLGDPADLMVKDKLIARGEVVVVDDRFGLRITELVSQAPERESGDEESSE